MAVGNTFGATALSSYGGFWIGTAIILTPGGFNIVSAYEGTGFDDVFGFYLMVSTTPLKHSAHSTDFRIGLVHLHLPPTHLHATLDCCLLLPLLHPRSRLPHAWYLLPPARKRRLPQSWWCFRYARCIRRLVQRFGWYRRH
jgi:hypothetical protein